MATFTSLGIGSGVDLNTMVTQLVALERAPLVQMQSAAKRLQTQVSSFGQIQSLFDTLQDAANKLTGNSLWTQAVPTSADTTVVAASGGAGAATGNYAVTVQALAGNQTLASATPLAASTALVGSGTLNITLGTWAAEQASFTPGAAASIPITVTDTDTLQTLRDKINSADAGVTATLVTDASGVRLSLRSTTSGAANGFKITAADGDGNNTDAVGLSAFAYDPLGGTTGMAFKQASQNARATINGIAVESATNEMSGVVEGVTLTLRKESASPINIAVNRDTEAVSNAVKNFAEAYNALVKFIAEQTKYDPASKVGGPLQGDSAAGSMQSQLRSILAQGSGASAAFPRLSDVGLHVQRNGTLSVDSAKLNTAMGNLTELKKAFANNHALAENDGFARRYADLSSRVLGLEGSVTTRSDGLRKLITKNSSDQAKVEERAERLKARLVSQYTALDANLAKLNALGGYVTQQLNALQKTSNSGR
ncbi:MAG TPA: flagellar filament capping protein FliD [Rubrivivax sp.]|nr:flagellar filament capping protein FliD [Rubrivivax sp.]